MEKAKRIQRFNQQLPEAFAISLRRMRESGDAELLNATLAAARHAGWTLRALGEALDVTGEAIRVRARQAKAEIEVAEIPEPPIKPEPQKVAKPPRWGRKLTDAEIAELRAMHEVAATVRGGTKVDDPARRVSEKYSARLGELHEAGVSYKELACAVGIGRDGIRQRLARHGHLASDWLPDHRRYRNRTPDYMARSAHRDRRR